MPKQLLSCHPLWMKPTYMDQYLYFESHHLTHVKRGVVRCLHDRARGIINMHDNLQKEVDHLVRVLKQNGYPVNSTSNLSSLSTKETADTSRHNRGQRKWTSASSTEVSSQDGVQHKAQAH